MKNERQPEQNTAAVSSRPRIAITMGDPAGIGPEIICKAFQHSLDFCRPIVYGSQSIFLQTLRYLDIFAAVVSVNSASDEAYMAREEPAGGTPHARGDIGVFQATSEDLRDLKPGELSANAGRAAGQCVVAATEAAMRGEVDAIVTAPLNKEALALGDFPYPGHTELLAHVTDTPRYGMLLLSAICASFMSVRMCRCARRLRGLRRRASWSVFAWDTVPAGI